MRVFILLYFIWGTARAASLDENARFTADKLRTYCKACHAVGDLKFIHSDDNEVLWDDILHDRAPISGKSWARRMIELLEWPTTEAPPGDETTWMPKGKKRELLAEDYDGGVSARLRMIATIREKLKSPSSPRSVELD